MVFGVYLLMSSFAYCLVLLWLFVQGNHAMRHWRRMGRFTLASVALSWLGLALFTALSARFKVMTFGVASDFNLPQDYLALGVAGWGILGVGLAGMFAPVWSGFLIWKRSHRN